MQLSALRFGLVKNSCERVAPLCPRAQARSAIFALYGVLGDIARSVGMLLVSYLVGLFGGRSYAFQATML